MRSQDASAAAVRRGARPFKAGRCCGIAAFLALVVNLPVHGGTVSSTNGSLELGFTVTTSGISTVINGFETFDDNGSFQFDFNGGSSSASGGVSSGSYTDINDDTFPLNLRDDSGFDATAASVTYGSSVQARAPDGSPPGQGLIKLTEETLFSITNFVDDASITVGFDTFRFTTSREAADNGFAGSEVRVTVDLQDGSGNSVIQPPPAPVTEFDFFGSGNGGSATNEVYDFVNGTGAVDRSLAPIVFSGLASDEYFLAVITETSATAVADMSVVPLPGALPLMLTGMVAAGWMARRTRRASA